MNFLNPDTLLYLVSNLFGIYVRMGFLDIFFRKHKQNTKLKYGIFVMFYLINSGLHLAFGNPSINLSVNILFMFLMTCAYKSKLSLKLVSTILIMAVIMAADQIPYAILRNLGFLDNIATVTNILSNILFFILVLVLNRIATEVFYGSLLWTQFVMIISIPLGSIIILTIAFALIENSLAVLCITTILLFMDVMVFYFYEILIRSYADKQVQDSLERQNAAYAHEFEVISQSDNKIRRVKHDLINHLFILQEFITANKNEKALAYIHKIYDFTENKEQFVATGNHQIDSILNYKLQKAKDMGAELYMQISIPSVLNISPFDINVILGNLLDNALEALKDCEEKQLDVCMNLTKELLQIAISNTFKTAVNRQEDKFLTSKADKENHGIGLENVKATVAKYSGEVEFSMDENIFTVEISMINEEM